MVIRMSLLEVSVRLVFCNVLRQLSSKEHLYNWKLIYNAIVKVHGVDTATSLTVPSHKATSH